MKKKIMALLLAVTLLIACAAPMSALAAETKSAKVKMSSSDGTLNLRSSASKTSNSAGYVKAGDAVKVYVGTEKKDSEGETWIKLKVTRTGKVGYLKTKYISYTSSSSSGSGSSGTTVYVGSEGGSLKVRSGPGTEFSVAGYVKHGTSITVLERGSTWSRIKTKGGTTGYIKTKYIKGSSSSGSSTGTASGNLPSGSYELVQVMTKTALGSVNLRSGAGANYSSLTTLSRGTKLYKLGKTGDWYKVKTTGGRIGYIKKDYIVFGVTAKTTGEVNFRKGAGTGYSVIKALPKSATVTLHSVSGEWAKITTGGRTGYVHISYLKI